MGICQEPGFPSGLLGLGGARAERGGLSRDPGEGSQRTAIVGCSPLGWGDLCGVRLGFRTRFALQTTDSVLFIIYFPPTELPCSGGLGTKSLHNEELVRGDRAAGGGPGLPLLWATAVRVPRPWPAPALGCGSACDCPSQLVPLPDPGSGLAGRPAFPCCVLSFSVFS